MWMHMGFFSLFLTFARQLEGEVVVDVDANQLAVLQVVIDRRPDLDPLGLTSALALLARSSQVLGSCPRLGKCMMAYLTKYGKKVSFPRS